MKQPTPILQVRSFLESMPPLRSAFSYQIQISATILLTADSAFITRSSFICLSPSKHQNINQTRLSMLQFLTKSQPSSATNAHHRISQPSLLEKYHSIIQPRQWSNTINELARKTYKKSRRGHPRSRRWSRYAWVPPATIHSCQSSDILQMPSVLDFSISNTL